MKTLHLYLTRQVLVTLVMTVAVFTFVLMLGSVLKEVLGLLVNRQASLFAVAKAIGLLIPFVMVFALPMGMLTATLLVFGRFSADGELTAARASGVSLLSLVTPVLLLAAALSGVTALINLQLAPQCRLAYKDLLYAIRNARPATFIPERSYVDLDGSTVYVSKIRGTNLEDVLIYSLNKSNQLERSVRADRGTLVFDAASNEVHVVLIDFTDVSYDSHGRPTLHPAAETTFTYKLPALRDRGALEISEMTFWQLWDKWRELEQRLGESAAPGKLPTEEMKAKMKQLRTAKRSDITSPVRVQMHRQMAFSFSCLAFTLIGIPLGIRAHRRETSMGIAIALVLVAIYYSFFVLGQALETRHEWAPHLILWIPNFLFQAVGMVLLNRANRGR
jgi:lipopolysaccharide export system permease protein